MSLLSDLLGTRTTVSSSPAAQSDQPKGPEAPSLAKGSLLSLPVLRTSGSLHWSDRSNATTPGSQAALSEKQPETKLAEKTEDSAGAPARNVQASSSMPLPLACNVDSTPGPDTDPELEEVTDREPTTAAGAPIDRQRMLRRRRALIIDMRFAKFFTGSSWDSSSPLVHSTKPTVGMSPCTSLVSPLYCCRFKRATTNR